MGVCQKTVTGTCLKPSKKRAMADRGFPTSRRARHAPCKNAPDRTEFIKARRLKQLLRRTKLSADSPPEMTDPWLVLLRHAPTHRFKTLVEAERYKYQLRELRSSVWDLIRDCRFQTGSPLTDLAEILRRVISAGQFGKENANLDRSGDTMDEATLGLTRLFERHMVLGNIEPQEKAGRADDKMDGTKPVVKKGTKDEEVACADPHPTSTTALIPTDRFKVELLKMIDEWIMIMGEMKEEKDTHAWSTPNWTPVDNTMQNRAMSETDD